MTRATEATPSPSEAAAMTLRRLEQTSPRLVGVCRARDVSPATAKRTYLHAGPPIRTPLEGPLRGAVMGGLIFEGEAVDAERASAIVDAGDLELIPCHDASAVGAMAGIVTPNTPVVVVDGAKEAAFSPLNEGLGRAVRFGCYDAATLHRLRWLRDILAPVLDRAAAREEIDLALVMAEGLRRGDECHNRTVACGAALMLRLLPALLSTLVDADETAAVVAEASANPHFFGPFALAACKAMADAGQGIPDSPIVTAIASNGAELGIRVSGLGEEWFTAPLPPCRATLFPGHSPRDAHPLLGDSTIAETVGLGLFAIGAAPGVLRYVGRTAREADALARRMRRITDGESGRFLIPAEDFRGAPVGVNVHKVTASGTVPVVNHGIAHRVQNLGQVGAGVTELPLEPFGRASRLLADRAAAGAADAPERRVPRRGGSS